MKGLQEFKDWKKEILENNDRDKMLEFVWELMKSPYIEYHYDLITDKTLDKEFRRDLSSRFNEHGEKGEDFLLNKLDQNQDYEFQGEIIYQLAKLNKKHKEETLKYARELTESKMDYTRNRALIALGWIGKIADTKILRKHLLEDTDKECRAWSASSYMQMWFKRKSDNLKIKAFEGFQKALLVEKDYFVLSVILNSIREIGKTKLGISQTALNDLDIEKIEISKIKAIKYLKKQLKEK